MLFAPEEPGGETLRVRVFRVFDGDGFLSRVPHPMRDVEIEVAVRLGFIDAPELGQPGGTEARDFLKGLIGGQWVELAILMKMDTGGIVDRHGRVVAVPYLRTEQTAGATTIHTCRNIELEMILNGWAWVLERYCPEPHYLGALEDARVHRRGIWAYHDNIPPWEFKKLLHRQKAARKATRPIQPNLFPE